MKPAGDIHTDIVLIGGGHAHVEVLRAFAMAPLEGVRLSVIARDVLTPYSGMLPGYLAGHYDHDEAHVDLRPLAARAGARLIHAAATGLDPQARRIAIAGRPPLRFDLASLDIGSAPAMPDIAGAGHAIPVKPVDGFLARWQTVEERALAGEGTFHVVVVGGGAGGVEVCLGLFHRLRRRLVEAGGDPDRLKFALVTDSPVLLPRHGRGVRRRMHEAFARAGVALHIGHRVGAVSEDAVSCDDGLVLTAQACVMVTTAGPAPWLGDTGLALDGDGFVAVDACLRSLSHPHVLAAGDIAAFTPRPLVKNGVYAVRQGPRLADNLRRLAQGLSPKPFQPQRQTLALITTGQRHAIASRGPLALEGAWVWRWKDAIDRRWMDKYRDLPAMPEMAATPMRCGGCGAKVPALVLRRALARLDLPAPREDVVIGLHGADDAAVLAPPPGRLLVQTVDQFPAFLDDPWLFGRIAAVHALSDLHAMGAQPAAAMALAGLLVGRAEQAEDDLVQMLSGALACFAEEGCALVGGHTSQSERMSLGFAVTGWADPSAIVRKSGLRPGDRLILTKPLGTGALFAADMRGLARGDAIEAALAGMARSNGAASRILIGHGASAMTDVTGFGLAGHLMEMLTASGVAARLDADAIPAYPQARDLLAQGIASTLHRGNVLALEGFLDTATADPLLFDPQTAGGLLAGVPAERASACLAALHAAGEGHAAIVGTVEAAGAVALRLA